jgi:hypothetical protein
VKTFGLALLLVISAIQSAAADVCVVLDESRDTLAPEDRRAATISFAQALAKNGLQVGGQNCTTTFTFYNVKLGGTISVYVIGPTGPTEGRASKLDELPLVYEQLAHSLVSGQPMGSASNTDRTNATIDQMAPRRVSADGLKYVRLGYGAVTGKTSAVGTAFGFGYRYELDQIGIDISLFNMVWASTDTQNMGSKGGINGELIGIGVVNYQTPLSNNSIYYGGRIGYGLNDFFDESTDGNYSGSGLQLTAVGGFEMLRSSTIRLFVEIDITAPLYTSSATFDNGTDSKRWAPVAALTIGAGLGHSNTVAVVNR